MEQAQVFGQYDHLVGVENIVPSQNRAAMIMMTPGMLHNTGPFRLHVDIARCLENNGISSLRFDISGIGESLGIGATGKSIERAAAEAIEAMDYLMQTHGIEEFILFGLCSGADDSIQTALQDNRVKGVIAMDGLGYSTTKSQLQNAILLARKSLSLRKVENKIRHITGTQATPASLAQGDDIREFPETAEAACRELQQLVDKAIQLHFIYTGGTEYYNYAEQFYDMLPNMNWRGTESTRYYPQMDHVALLCEDRELLVDDIVNTTLSMIERLQKIAA